MEESLHAVAVLILSPQGTPLVRDPKKPIPRYWKLPGGRSEGAETPEECAVREIYQELGIEIDQDDLQVVDEQDRGSHTLTFFKINLASLTGLKKVGDEREEIRIFKLSEIAEMEDFFPNHKNIIQRLVDKK
ncbi:MAG: hypothetical protein RIT04_617 [Candidatus Parcubacteria bacterium]|jgi:8-oxo-dGTP diphosphatase